MSEKISKKRIRRYAKSLLEFLNEYEVVDLKSLEAVVGKEHIVKNDEKIVVYEKPAPKDTVTIAIEYSLPDSEPPIEVRVNEGNKDSQIRIRGGFTLDDYVAHGQDSDENIKQFKLWNSTNIAEVIEELKTLRNYLSSLL